MMLPLLPALLLCSVTVAPTNPPQAQEPSGAEAVREYRVIGMMPLTSLGSTDETVSAIGAIVENEMHKLLGDRLVTPSELKREGPVVRAALESCGGAASCLVEVTGALGWDAFVVGNIAGLGDRRVINLKLVDTHTGEATRTASEKATGIEDELISLMRKAVVWLVAPDRYTGVIQVLAPQTGVEVLVDGRSVGVTPLAKPRLDVAVGRHAIEARGEGLVSFSTMVQVAYDETKQVTVDLPQNLSFVGGSTPFRHRWWTWAIAGVGAMAAGLGGYFNYLHHTSVQKIERRALKNRLTSDNVDLYNDQREHWNRAVWLYGTGGGLILGAGVLLSLDFF